ncbi:MAG: polyprenyl synthetase family protein [Oscillospiraceae bacterium]|nr:polyprenyl synthetase family protein [Oscillospiraceae bacterium]
MATYDADSAAGELERCKADATTAGELERCKAVVEDRLSSFFARNSSYSVLYDAMRYSLLGGGKRIRAAICLKFCEAVCGDMYRALDAACAIEMLHAYSLIHDDLPCMDDDDMRRGLPSNHVAFGEFTAVLAGDALQAAAFGALASMELPAGAVLEMVRILANAAGPDGICGGQYLDMADVGGIRSKTELEEIYKLKTSALFVASAQLGVLAGGGTSEQVAAAGVYASAVGMAFQIRDDLLDYYADSVIIGKPGGSDEKNGKLTFVPLMGDDACEDFIRSETERAVGALDGVFHDAAFLEWLAYYLANREV